MHPIRASGLIALALLLLLAAACRKDSQPETAADSDQTKTAAEQGQSPSDNIPLSFRQALKELDFGQSSDTLGYLFRTLTEHELPQQPYTIVRHLDKEFGIGIRLDATPEQVSQLLGQIRIEGAAKYTFTNMDKDPNRPVLRLSEMGPEVKVTLGDLPPIIIVKMDPLGVRLEYEDPQSQFPGLFIQPSGQDWTGAVAIVPAQHPDLVFRFSEEMDTSSSHPDLPKGEWIDAYRYRLHLTKPEETMHSERISSGGTLEGFRSIKGNYVGVQSTSYSVIRVKPSDWLDMETGTRVGWSANDPLYETIVFSPDGESYVGTAIAGKPDGDTNGYYYNIVLERRGKPPVTIESYYFTNLLHQGSPVQWAGNDRVAYADHESLYIYSLKAGTRTTLFSTAGTNRYIHYAAYDPYSKQWNILTSTFDIKNASEYGPFPVDLHLLDDSGSVISHRSEWSLSPLDLYWLKQHPVIPAKNGIYRTFYRDGKAFTRFESRDGYVTELPGMIQYADEHQALLLEHIQGDEGIGQILHLWRPGQKQPKAASKAPGYIYIAGPQPVAVSEGDYYKYDAESDQWVLWESNPSISLSRQTSSGMYKK
jgi:hypothetical protein